ncbi:MAG: diguanylate cyclase [Vicinamibacteria bacterium]
MPTFDVLLGTFGAGIYSVVAVIHFDLWLRRRQRRGHLWLAGASACALIVDVTGIAIPSSPEGPVPFLFALNMLGVVGATACLTELMSELSGVPTALWARGLMALAVCCGLATLVFPPIGGVILVTCGILLISAMMKAVHAAREARRWNGVARAFVILVICLLADLAKDLALLPIPSNLPLLGFTILFLAAARSLNERFERDHDASRRDLLTGLHNRRSLLEAWDDAIRRARRSGTPIAIALADIDHFKRVNDALGHAAGDATLCAVANAIVASLRAQDVVSRWGGEEFMLLLPDTDREGARHVAECVRKAIEGLCGGHAVGRADVTLSLGVVQHRDDSTVDQSIARADAALYQAKQEGRNRVVVG